MTDLEVQEQILEKVEKGRKRMEVVRTTITYLDPFFAHLMFKIPTQETFKIQTAATDGKRILYNPLFFEDLADVKECMFVFVHEILHVIFCHSLRFQQLLKQYEAKHGKANANALHSVFNKAADYIINPILKAFGYKLPTGNHEGLYNEKYAGRTVEDLFWELLKEQKDKNQKGQGNDEQGDGGSGDSQGLGGQGSGGTEGGESSTGAGQGDESDDGADEKGKYALPDDYSETDEGVQPAQMSEQEQKKHQAEINRALVSAAENAKRQGKLSGAMAELVADLTTSKEDWRKVLDNLIKTQAQADFSLKKPNRRYTNRGIYLPTLWSEKLEDICIVVDISSSMSGDEYNKALSEIYAMESVAAFSKHIFFVNTAVVDHREMDEYEAVDFTNLPQGGGTDLEVVYDYIEEEMIEANAIIFLTDGGTCFNREPDYPVYWCIVGERNHHVVPDYGNVLYVD